MDRQPWLRWWQREMQPCGRPQMVRGIPVALLPIKGRCHRLRSSLNCTVVVGLPGFEPGTS